MYRQLAVESEEVSKSFDEYFDSVSGGKPLFIKHGEKYAVALELGLMKQLVDDVTFNIEEFTEDDGSITLSLVDFDTVVNGKTKDEATKLLIKDLRGYVQDYFEEPEVWGQDEHRASQIKEMVLSDTLF